MTPTVSLLVPNFNGERFLVSTLESLLGQSYASLQVTVVDNRSTDGSVAVARRFGDARLRVVLADEHVPIAANFNRALRLAEGPLVALCAADEVYETTWLQSMVRLLTARPDAFFACCKATSADEHGRVYLAAPERYKGTFWSPEEPCVFAPLPSYRLLQRGNFLILTTGVLRRSAVERIGLLNENYRFVADWEYWCRGFLAGYTVVGTHRPLVHYRRHGGMTTAALTSDLSRFTEELELSEWMARAGFEAGLLKRPRPDYRLLRRTLLSEFASRLAAGDGAGARRLRAFAGSRLPGAGGRLLSAVMGAACLGGRAGGMGLKAGEWLAVRGAAMGARGARPRELPE